MMLFSGLVVRTTWSFSSYAIVGSYILLDSLWRGRDTIIFLIFLIDRRKSFPYLCLMTRLHSADEEEDEGICNDIGLLSMLSTFCF